MSDTNEGELNAEATVGTVEGNTVTYAVRNGKLHLRIGGVLTLELDAVPLLEKLAASTSNKLDDKLVKVIATGLKNPELARELLK